LQTTRRNKRDPGLTNRHDWEQRTQPTQPTNRHLTQAARVCDGVLHGVGKSVFILAPFALLLLLIFGLGYVRLRHGPVSLKFLVAPIERGINAELDGSSARIDDVVVALSGAGGIEFQLRNLRLRERDGDEVASAPFAAVELSASALWSGRVVPARVELIRPRLLVSYSDTAGLSLSFTKPEPELTSGEPKADTEQEPVPLSAVPKPVPAKPPAPSSLLKRIDLARMVTDMSARARKRLDATSYLREVGLRNAIVMLEYEGRSTEWRVPSLAVELKHATMRSVISGRATIVSGAKPWELTFETDEQERARTLVLKTSVHELVPRTLATALPQLSLLQGFDMPIAGNATMTLSSEGDIRSANLQLDIGHGSLRLPAIPDAPLEIDGGSVKVSYDGAAQKIDMSPSTLRWRGSRITMSGTMTADNSQGAHPVWNYNLQAKDGAFGAQEFGVPAVALNSWHARGRIIPSRGEIALSEFVLRAGGGEIAMRGDLVAGEEPARTRLEGRISPMPLTTLKALWPKAIAPGARDWVGERVQQADVRGGSFQFESGANESGGAGDHALSFQLEADNVRMLVIDKMPLVAASTVQMQVTGDKLEIGIPEAQILLTPERTVPLKEGKFTANDIFAETTVGEIAFGAQTSLRDVLDVLERSPLTVMDEIGVPRDGIEGKFEGQFKVTLPLLADLPMSSIRLDGKAKIADGRAKGLFGPYNVQGAAIDLDITEKAVDSSGEMLINGVLAKVSWQRIFDAPADKQPPLRITANLDASDRNQLGLDVNHIVQGDVPVELTVMRGVRDEPSVRLRADLSNADLVLDNVSWRKPPGRSATLQCDIAKGRTGQLELQNFKVAGDDVAIEGWAAIGADNKLREFYFPDFSLNVITRMEVQGKLGDDNVWRVKAHGPTFDGREFFRSLFSLGQLAGHRPKPKEPREGIDLEAEIGTVIGFSEVSLRGVKLKLSKRGDQLTVLDARGTLDGGKPLSVVLKDGQPRKLEAESPDAGQAFKLIDFYPNIQGGRVKLEVNLDGKGPAEKTGTLWVENFRILGDPVVSEVFGSSAGGASAKKKRQVVRQVFDFDRMRVPFSVGYGQFVMEQSYLRGPLLGASIRGKVDFKMRRVNLGGTYVPLQGINAALCEIPVVGFIITGPGCDGVSGMTFAIQGPMDRPEVMVNPLSMLAPGIFREIFQMTNPNPRVLPRDEASGAHGDNARASSTSVTGPSRRADEAGNDTIDGWSSTIDSPRRRKRQ
jgi:hypothetical protein